MIAISPAAPMLARSQIQVYSPSGEGLLLLSVRPDRSTGSFAHCFFSGNKLKSYALDGPAMRDW